MELLKKSVSDAGNRRKDNSDKKELFAKDRHPRPAQFYKDEWAFIEDVTTRENISYQLQYLEFIVHLYNDYQVYLTIESLLCKNIIVTVGGIIEAAIYDLIASARKRAGLRMDGRTDFTVLLGQAYHEYQFIDKDLWQDPISRTLPSRVRSDFLASARREEEVVTSALHRRRATTRGEEIARTLRDTANSNDSIVAPPRSIQWIHLRSSLLGLAGIGSYRGGRSF